MKHAGAIFESIYGVKPTLKTSYSQVSNWLECPNLHYLISVRKEIPYDSNEYTVIGSAVHNAMQWGLMRRSLDLSHTPDELVDVFLKTTKFELEKAKSEGQELDPVLFLEKGLAYKKMIPHSLDIFQKEYPDTELYDIEYEINMDVDFLEFDEFNVNFRGFIDVILKKGDTYYLIDIKTTNKGWTRWSLNRPSKILQLLSYKYFFSKAEGIPFNKIKCSYFFLRNSDREIYKTEMKYNSDQLAEFKRALQNMCYSAYVTHKHPRIKGCREEYCDCKKYYDSLNKD